MNRPLVWVALGFVGGTLLANADARMGWGTALAVIIAVLWARRSNPNYVPPLLIALLFGVLGATLWQLRHLDPPGDALAQFAVDHPESAMYAVIGTVERPDILLPEGDYVQFRLRVDRVEYAGKTYSMTGGVLVKWTDPEWPVFSSERIRVQGPLEADLARINPNTRSFEDHLRGDGIHTAVRVYGRGNVERLEEGSWTSPSYWMSRFRSDLAARLSRVVPLSAQPLVLSVWLGDRRRIGNEVYEEFIKSGTAHILAVSGVHTGLIFVSIRSIFRLLFGLRFRRACALVTMFGVLAFALMSGARIPTVRASIMLILYLSAELFDREPDAPTALSLAAFFFAAYDPDSLSEVSFQLSFLSIASILLYSEPLAALFTRLPKRLSEGVTTSSSVQLLSMPVAVSLAGVLPVAGPLVNLIVIPLLAGVLWLSFLTSVCVYLVEPLALLFGHALAPLVWSIHALAGFVSDVPGSFRVVPTPTVLGTLAYWGAMMCLAALLYRVTDRRRLLMATVTLAATSFALWTPFRSPAEVVFLDVGHGDSTFVRTPGGSRLLVDAGDRNIFVDQGKRTVVQFLRANHVSYLDAVFVTHDDMDHIGGMVSVLNAMPVGALYLGVHPSDSPEEAQLLEVCAEKEIPVHRIQRGDRIRAAGALVEVLHPGSEPSRESNDNSLVLHVSWPGMRVLLTGDIEELAEEEIQDLDVAADVMKVPHHGSQTSSTESFIESVYPAVAVVSGGRRRGGKVVRDFVLDRYKDRDVLVYRTDHLGGIRVFLEEGKLHVTSAREQRGYIHR